VAVSAMVSAHGSMFAQMKSAGTPLQGKELELSKYISIFA